MYTLTNSTAKLITPLTTCQALHVQTEKALTRHTQTLEPYLWAPYRWVQNTTTTVWTGTGPTGTGRSLSGWVSIIVTLYYVCFTLTNLYGARILLHKKLMKTLVEVKEHKHVFQHFMELQFKDIPNWLAMVTVWEQDHTNSNPYVVTKSGYVPVLLFKHSLSSDMECINDWSQCQAHPGYGRGWFGCPGAVTLNEVNVNTFIVVSLGL